MTLRGPLDVSECNKLVANAVKREKKIIFKKRIKQSMDTMKQENHQRNQKTERWESRKWTVMIKLKLFPKVEIYI